MAISKRTFKASAEWLNVIVGWKRIGSPEEEHEHALREKWRIRIEIAIIASFTLPCVFMACLLYVCFVIVRDGLGICVLIL